MSADNERRARELLAQIYRDHGHHWAVWGILNAPLDELIYEISLAIRAIVAALDEPATDSAQIGSKSVVEPAGEAVAWLANDGSGRVLSAQAKETGRRVKAAESAGRDFSIPLYTHPAPPVVDEAALRALVAKWRRDADSCSDTGSNEERGYTNAMYVAVEELESVLFQPSQPGEDDRITALEAEVARLRGHIREIRAVLGPGVPASVTDEGARWEWANALEEIDAAMRGNGGEG